MVYFGEFLVYWIGICIGIIFSCGLVIFQTQRRDYKELVLLNKQHPDFITDYLRFKEELKK